MAELIVEAEGRRPVSIQLVGTILAIQDILTDLRSLGVHRLTNVGLSIEVEACTNHRTCRTVDRTGLHRTHLALDRQVRDRYVQQRVDEVEGLHVGRTTLHLALCRGVECYATKEIQTIQIEGGSQSGLLCQHRLTRTCGEAQLIEIDLLQVLQGIPCQSDTHRKVGPTIADAGHILRILMVMELLIVRTIKPVTTTGRTNILIRTQLLQRPA